MSKYPPGQGLFLMLGQILFAKPIVGVWLSTAAACMATYWMLIEFVPSPWALTGGLFSAANPVVLEWSQTYWGGSVAMLGGALLVGAWGRLFRQTSWSASITFGAGLIILANSRPFEGLVLCVPLTISLLVHARGRLAAIVFPNLALLVLGLVWMAYYNHRITGNALRMPFVEYTLQYDRYPKFWFLPLRPMPVLRNQALQWVHLSFEMGHYPLLRTFSGFFVVARYRLDDLIFDNLGLAALLLPFTASFALAGNPRVRWLLIALAVFLLGLLSETFQFPHYTAPATPVILLLTILGAGQVAKWEWRKPQFGRRLMSTIVIGSIAGIAMCVARPLNLVPKLIRQQQVVEMKAPLHTGRHLVFVGYAPLHEFYVDYVYNPANLQDSRIIWARYFGPDKDLPVAKYFTGRQVWVLDADKMKLTPYLEHRPNTGPQTQEIH